jgi:hypothetical protein
MKKKVFKELIQKPLRFHHQDIHEELEDIKTILMEIRSCLPTNLKTNPQEKSSKSS